MKFPRLSVDANRPPGLSPTVRAILAAVLVAFAVSACSRNEGSRGAMPMLLASKVQSAPPEHGTLSREHAVVIDVPETELETKFRSVAGLGLQSTTAQPRRVLALASC